MKKTITALVLVLCLLCTLVPAAMAGEVETPRLTIMQSDSTLTPFDKNSMCYRLLQEKTGVEIDFQIIDTAEYGTKTATMLATNQLPDIMQVSFSQVTEYASTGMLLNIQQYLDDGQLPYYAAAIDTSGDIVDYYKVDGEIWSFLRFWEIGLPNGAGAMIRGDMLEKVGLDVPETWEELYEALKAFKEYDPECTPWYTRWGSLQIDYQFGAGYVAYGTPIGLSGFYYDIPTAQYKCGFLDAERYMAFLEYCSKLYKEGLVDPDFITTTNADFQEACKNGTAMFTFNNIVFLNAFNMALQTEDPGAYWIPLHTLENPFGERRGNWSTGVGEWQPQSGNFIVSADCANIDAALKFMDFCYSPEGVEIQNWGVEGETFEKDENGNYRMIESFIEGVRNGEYELNSYLSGWDQNFCLVLNDWAYRAETLDDAGRELYNFWLEDEYCPIMPPTPPFTEEELEELTELASKIEIAASDIYSFMTGKRDVSEWPTVMEQIREAGAERYVEIYNIALARIHGN